MEEKGQKASVKIGGMVLNLSFRFPGTERYFSRYIVGKEHPESPCISMSDEEAAVMEAEAPPGQDRAFSEYTELVCTISEALLGYGRICIHGLAFVWQGKAFLLTGPSGVGKTTQYRNWKALYGKDVMILNGDKPILEFRDRGGITVHHSPWNGKEGYGSRRTAELVGIICLKQGREDAIRRMSPRESALAILPQFFVRMFTEENCRGFCRLAERLVAEVPFWELTNLGGPASAVLTHDTLLEKLQGPEESSPGDRMDPEKEDV